jgi:L-ascorbate metabolism protein UlaG (beta-lactamase superfamily)
MKPKRITMKTAYFVSIMFALAMSAAAQAQNVKVTPLGSHAGEFCRADRAILFEDPTGVRLLYDASTTVAGPKDPRLGDVHAVLVSHGHNDHIGDRAITAENAGSCNAPQTVPSPNTNVAEIAAAKNSALIMEGYLAAFLATRVQKIRGTPTPNCEESGNERETVVPVAAACLATAQVGGARTIKLKGQSKGVVITVVLAQHSSNIPSTMLSDPLGKELSADGLNGFHGLSTGYIINFTNGLTVYLTGDTAIYGDMKTIIHDFYHPQLVVFNLGSNIPPTREAGFAINELIKPDAVIVSHVNEAATENGGKLKAGTRSKEFMDVVKGSKFYLPLSDKTMEFDGKASCVRGC